MLGITTTNARVGGFRGGILADSKTIYNRIIADGGVSNLTRLNFFVKGLKAIYGDLANVPVCYDAHWIGYKLGSGTGATAGQAAAKLYSLTVAGDAVQATAASQPLLLSHNGASTDNYWWGSGVSGNYCSTPNAVANQITGDIEIIAKIQGTFNTGQRIARKRSTISNYDFYISDITNTQLTVFFGAAIGTATSSVGFTMISGGIYVKATRTVSNGDVKFYTSLDGITYTQLGTTQTTILGNLSSSTDIVEIGSASGGAAANFQGKISRLTISNSIGGAPVVDFNPATYNASTSQTQWTSAIGEVWTINTGTATSGYKGVLVDRTIVQSDGVDDLILTGNVDLSATDKLSMFTSLKRLNNNVGIVFNVGSNTNRFLNLVNTNVIGIANMNGGLTNEFTLPNNTSLFLLTNTLDRSQIALSEQNGYFNNILQTKIPVSASDTSGNLGNNPISLFARIDTIAPYNGIVNTAILALNVSDSTQRTSIYNLIRSLNNNAF